MTSTRDAVRTHIRWMIRRDMADVLSAERASFEYAWTEDDFLRCLRQRNCIGMVAERSDRVIGFMIYELHKTRLHVLNFAVAPEFRRNGVGHLMIDKLIAKLSTHRRTKITLAVRVLRNYYEDSGEDAFLMEYAVGAEDDDWGHGGPTNRIAAFDSR